MKTFGNPTFVLNVEPTPIEHSPRKIQGGYRALEARGYHLQMPPISVMTFWGKDAGRDERREWESLARPMRPLLSRQIGR